ncbi:MAG TPA: tetratricopeptide repeat protein [Candidatus Polarisedimenticolia bacterium]|nr:tetratricopeptide repeat protein [Candidatus Polarisedimenticolia bacterium]
MDGQPQVSSEETFRKGLAALERRTYKEAISLFQGAIDQERQEGVKNPRMKYVSFLGLATTLMQGRSDEGLKLCEQAVKREFFDPDLYCNLGIVYLRNRQKARAFEAFQKGLNLKPGHRRILEELERYERRDHPVFAFLPRTHLVNRLAGRLRYRLRILFSGSAPTEA